MSPYEVANEPLSGTARRKIAEIRRRRTYRDDRAPFRHKVVSLSAGTVLPREAVALYATYSREAVFPFPR